MTRTATPKAARLAALMAADWTCQQPGCGRSVAHLARLRDRLLRMAQRRPARLYGTAWRPGLLRTYKIAPNATLLEVDHAVEQADGGTHAVTNLQVLCVFCHHAKTLARIGKRARAPKKDVGELTKAKAGQRQRGASEAASAAARQGHGEPRIGHVHPPERQPPRHPEQLEVVRYATLADLRSAIAAIAEKSPALVPAPPRERRHFSHEQAQAAAERRERAILDNPWGC